MMSLLLYFFLSYVSFTNGWSLLGQSNSFTDYSSKMGVTLTGYMTAFGDFDADRATDIFVLDKVGDVQQVDVILMAKDAQLPAKRLPLLTLQTNAIFGMVVGDFDGDSILDIVLYRGSLGSYTLEIAYGKVDRSGVNPPVPIANGTSFRMQPLHLDWNADMIGDLFCQQSSTLFWVLKGQNNRTFSQETFTINDFNIQTLMYSKFTDINKDGNADILLIGRNKEKKVVLVSLVKDGEKFVYDKTYTSEKSPQLIGQGVIGDFQFNGDLMMMIPICDSISCDKSSLLMCTLYSLTCVETSVTMKLDQDDMVFIPGTKLAKLSLAMPEIVPFSCGDIYLSGEIQCLAIVAKATDPSSKTVVIIAKNSSMNYVIRTLEGNKDLYANVAQVAVFDLLEDGIPDIIVTKPQGSSGIISPLHHDSPNDAYFIKVIVLNGLCYNPDNCPNKKLPYGIPLPGIQVSYSTEGSNGGLQASISSLCSDSDFTSLQLPYAHFGLGAFANYVEKLYVKLPSANVSRQHTVSFIVPKTQIVIIPYPLNKPSLWTNKLFLEPFHNMKVIYVAAALLGTFFIVSVVACILQYLEIRVDRLEKMQEAQKFHFDAM